MNAFPFFLDEETHHPLPFAPLLQGQPDEANYPVVRRAAPPAEATLAGLVEHIEPGAFREAIVNIFADLTRLLGYLCEIETYLRQDSPLADALPLFILVHREARVLVDCIETSKAELTDLPAPVKEVLDCTSYAINFELRRAHPQELQTWDTVSEARQLRAAVEHAHGSLSNCFQQSTIALARVFDSALNGALLFDDYRLRQQQSLTLCDDLASLVRLVRRAEKDRDPALDTLLVERLREFGEGSVHYLMFRDWEIFERCVVEIEATRGTAQWHAVIHRLGCYLETLLGHVRQRT
ncbi:MAG: hypothetical protein ACRD9R_11320, partial [Pyrinomonadaceae bacterium]